MLSHISLTDGSGSDKVEAGGGVVDPGVEVVARGNGDGETFWIVWSGIIAAIERFCNKKLIFYENFVTKIVSEMGLHY